eukprot:2309978-Pleurochrysis_carterae.AAC.3
MSVTDVRKRVLRIAGAVALVLEVDAVAMARPMCSPCVKARRGRARAELVLTLSRVWYAYPV